MKRQIFYRLTEILSFYAFLRPARKDIGTKPMLVKTVCGDGQVMKNELIMCTDEFHNPPYEHLWNHIDTDFCSRNKYYFR